MLKQVKLKNFQSHNDSTLEFSKGVNAIVGTSDSGKSAILRALNSCIHGDLPNSYRTYDSKQTEVTITVDDHEITRRRSDKENEYQLDNGYFRALNRTVPEEISNTFNMNDLNIQYQLDGPFLLGETPGEVAKRLNKAVNLDIIDSSIKYINSLRNETNSSLKHYTEQLETNTKELEKYNNLDAIESAIHTLHSKQEEQTKIRESLSKLQVVVGNITNDKEKLADIEYVLAPKTKLAKDLDKLVSNTEARDTLSKKIALLKSKLGDFINHSTEKNKIDSKLQTIKDAGREVSKLQTKEEDMNNKKKSIDTLKDLLEKINEHRVKVKSIVDSKKTKEEELQEITPDECPLCGKITK